MTEAEHLLTCLSEECAEVSQRVSKAIRFGLDEVQPGQLLSNAERLRCELTDIVAVCEMLSARNLLPPIHGRREIEAKIKKVEGYMTYSRDLGALV